MLAIAARLELYQNPCADENESPEKEFERLEDEVAVSLKIVAKGVDDFNKDQFEDDGAEKLCHDPSTAKLLLCGLGEQKHYKSYIVAPKHRVLQLGLCT